MISSRVLVVLLLILAGCGAAPPREATVVRPQDEEAIHAEIQAFSAAWSSGDAAALAAFYTEDGVRVGAGGDTQQGRDELKIAYEKLLGGPLQGARVVQQRGTIRWLTPDLAVWRGGIEITPPGGAPPIAGHVVQVMKRVDGRWLILEGHPKLFPPPPPPAQ